MKSVLFAAVFATLMFVSSQVHARDIEGRYFIKFKPGIARTFPQVEKHLQEHGLRLDRQIEEIQVFVAQAIDPKNFIRKELAKLKKAPDVLYIEPVREVHANLIPAQLIPNDPLLERQHGMTRLRAPEAWNYSVGSRDVIVAVSDTGIAFDHGDLKNQIWTNANEVAANGIDDDGNGFVDDVHGWDFFAKDGNPTDENSPGHGTHVAGIIGAEGNNGSGVTGVNWVATIMPVRFLGGNGSGSTEAGIDTILYAVKNGARIINASWGGGGDSQALRDAVAYMFDHGALLIAASGNNKSDSDRSPHFPSAVNHPGVISVASSVSDGTLSSFSNWGNTSVDLAAPGSSILSTTSDGQYKELSGTSMATPHVAGAAALILSIAPQLSALELRNALLNAVEERTTYKDKLATSGDLSLFKCLEQIDAGFQVWPSRITLNVANSFQFTAYDAAGTVSWSTSNAKIATIDSNGRLTAKAVGQVTVTAQDSNNRTAITHWVKVIAASPGRGGS